jgi:hypothetical protein
LPANDITLTPRELDKLIDWMRRSGRPQTVQSLARRYLEILRDEKGIRDNTPPRR